MSWNVNIPDAVTLETLDAAAADAWDGACNNRPGPPFLGGVPKDQQEPAKDAFKAGLQAVKDIIASGAVGKVEGNYHVTFTGHANPGHEPQPNWADDFVNLHIDQLK